MARKKVKLQYISNNTTRRTSLKNRQRSLLKKVHEISVLCGVDACCIVYNPEEPTDPQVWPQPQDAKQILMTFYNLPEKERTRKMTNHLAFMQERVATLKKKIVKCNNDNDKLEVHTNLYEGFVSKDFAGLTANDLLAVGEVLDDLIAKIYSRLSCMSCPPEAQDEDATGAGKGAVVEQVVASAITATAAPVTLTAIAGAEAGPSNQAKQGSELSAEKSGDDESSDGETELSDTEDDDE